MTKKCVCTVKDLKTTSENLDPSSEATSFFFIRYKKCIEFKIVNTQTSEELALPSEIINQLLDRKNWFVSILVGTKAPKLTDIPSFK